MRIEFWDSQTETATQGWAVLRTVSEALIASDLALAATFVQAAGLVCPSGAPSLARRRFAQAAGGWCAASPRPPPDEARGPCPRSCPAVKRRPRS